MPHTDHALLGQLSSNSTPYRDPLAVIDWGALDGQPVHAVFLLVNPSPAAHLKVLSRLAFVLRAPGFAALLRSGAGFEEVLTATAQLEPRG